MKRTTALASLMVLIPLVAVLVLGVWQINVDEGKARMRASAILADRLMVLEQLSTQAQAQWQQKLLEITQKARANPDQIHQQAEAEPWVRALVGLDPKGRIEIPNGRPASVKEQEFFVRSANLLSASWVPTVPESGRYDPRGGWQEFYWHDGVQLLYWLPRDPLASKGFIVLEVERNALLADLVARLSRAWLSSEEQTQHYIALYDDQNKVFLSWGRATFAEDSRPIVVNSNLSAALRGWSFEWKAGLEAINDQFDPRLWLGLGIGLIVAVFVWVFMLLRNSISKQLQEAGQRVSFVNQVSHELKTPLTNIRLYAELLESRFAKEPAGTLVKEREYSAIILREGRKLSRLIHNVLTFGRRQKADKPNLREGIIDDAVRLSAESFAASFYEKGLDLSFKLACPGGCIFDADWLDQMLGNLLSNAEKYARDGHSVELASVYKDGTATVTVSDRGPGLPPHALSKAFLPFERFHTRHTDGVGGAGLGLAIVRDLARAHGGDAGYLANPGGGARFWFSLRADEVSKEA